MNKLKKLLAGGVVLTSLMGSPNLDSYIGNSSSYVGNVYAQDKEDSKDTIDKFQKRIGDYVENNNLKKEFSKNNTGFFFDIDYVDEKLKRDIHPFIDRFFYADFSNPSEELKLNINSMLKQGLNEKNPYYLEFKKGFENIIKNPLERSSIFGFPMNVDELKLLVNSFSEESRKVYGVGDFSNLENLSKRDRDFLFSKCLNVNILTLKRNAGTTLDFISENKEKFPDYSLKENKVYGLYNNLDMNFFDMKTFPNSTYDCFVSAGYEDQNKDGEISIDEITRIEDSSKLYFNKTDKLILGINANVSKVRPGSIELYNPKNKKVLGSKFDIDSELIKGEFGLESIVDKYGVGTYRAAFSVDGKIRYLSSFEVREK